MRTGERVSRVHVDIAGPMAIVLAGEREYVYVVVDDYSRAVYTSPLCLKSAVQVFKAFRVAAENESEKRIREITMDDVNYRWARCATSASAMNQAGPSVPHHPASNGVAE